MLQHHCVIKLIPLQIWGFQKVISTADFIVKITFPAHSSSGCAIISQLAACERVCTQRSVKGKWLQFPVPACRDEISCVCVCGFITCVTRLVPWCVPELSLTLHWFVWKYCLFTQQVGHPLSLAHQCPAVGRLLCSFIWLCECVCVCVREKDGVRLTVCCRKYESVTGT